jgi:hypothetical protein
MMSDLKAGQHVIDRMLDRICTEQQGDLLVGFQPGSIERLAVPAIREGIRLRQSRGQAVTGDLDVVDRMSDAKLRQLCAERLHVLSH